MTMILNNVQDALVNAYSQFSLLEGGENAN